MTGVNAVPLARGVGSQSWPKASGVVTHSRERARHRTLEVDIGYRYEVGGRTYVGNRYRFQSWFVGVHAISRDVEMTVGRYRHGDPVQVAVNPADPADSVLEPGLDVESLLPFGLGLGLLLLGCGRFEKVRETIEQRMTGLPRYGLAKALVLVGGALCVWGAWDLHRGIRSAGWPTADGSIVFSRAHTGGPAETLLWYEYYVDGRRYLASNYRNVGNATPFAAVAEEAANRYPVGRAVKVHYQPGDPANAMLEPGVWWGNFVMPAIGALVLGAAWVAKRFAEITASRRGQ